MGKKFSNFLVSSSFPLQCIIKLHPALSELIAFSFGPDKNDEMRKRVSSSFDHFFDVRLKTDDEIVKISRNFKRSKFAKNDVCSKSL